LLALRYCAQRVMQGAQISTLPVSSAIIQGAIQLLFFSTRNLSQFFPNCRFLFSRSTQRAQCILPMVKIGICFPGCPKGWNRRVALQENDNPDGATILTRYVPHNPVLYLCGARVRFM
jgi:hypothetical protein